MFRRQPLLLLLMMLVLVGAPSASMPTIPKRIRWFASSPSKIATSQFLRENADMVQGFYYCCFGLYILEGTVCEGKH